MSLNLDALLSALPGSAPPGGAMPPMNPSGQGLFGPRPGALLPPADDMSAPGALLPLADAPPSAPPPSVSSWDVIPHVLAGKSVSEAHAAAQAAAADPFGVGPPPAPPHVGGPGDFFDSLIMQGAGRRMRQENYANQVAAYNMARMNAMFGQMSPDERKAAILNPEAAAKAIASHFEAANIGAGDSRFIPGQGMITAPNHPMLAGADQRVIGPDGATTTNAATGKYVIDPASGGVLNDATGAATPGVFGGDFDPVTGVSKRTAEQRPVKTFHDFPQGNQAGFYAPDGAGGAAGSAPAAGAGGGALANPDGTPTAYGQSYLDATQRIESGGKGMSARNGLSTGSMQFHPATFRHALPGGNINSAADQRKAALNLAVENAGKLQGLGVDPSQSNLYLMHQQGPAGGPALFKADPTTNAIDALTPAYGGDARQARRAIVNNVETKYRAQAANWTVAQFRDYWAQRYARAAGSARAGGDAPGALLPPADGPGAPSGGSAPSGADAPGALLPPADGSGAPSGGSAQIVHQGQAPRILTADQVPNGKAGWTYKMEGGSLTPIPPEFTMETALKNRTEYQNSQEAKDYGEAVSALQGLHRTVGSVAPGGATGMAALDTTFRSLNPKGSVRQGNVQTFLEHTGLPEKVKSYVQSVVGNGPLSPQLVQEMGRVAWNYTKSARDNAQHRADQDLALAQKNGVDVSKLNEGPLDMPDVPRWAQDPLPPPALRQVGKAYWSRKGPATWTGKGWVLQQ